MSLVDPRVVKQAELLVNYSLKVKRGERILISADPSAEPLVRALYKYLLRKGAAEVRISMQPEDFGEIYFKNTTSAQRKIFPKIALYETRNVDCVIAIASGTNTKALSGINPNLISQRAQVTKRISNYRVEHTRWLITQFPSNASAQEADMSLSDYQEFVFAAINNVAWKEVAKKQKLLVKIINKTKRVRILAKDTDLTLGIAGRKAISASGENNMPDGEVFTSVIEDQADGYILFFYPAIYFGRQFENVKLEFKKGKLVLAKAGKGELDLNKILSVDAGAKRIGELGFGNNYQINRFTKNILFDEKIGGSIHIALGKGYTDTLSKNKSSLHWDMIKDLRDGGEIWFDNKLVQKNGKWRIKL